MKVSVIIPTYNRSKLLVAAVESVLAQTYQDFEIIVVDDGSTDDTEQQMRRYVGRVTYIKQRNSGVNAARNHAISVSSSEYIALLDNDDLWLECKLELQVALLERHTEAGFVFSDFIIRKESGAQIKSGLGTWHPPQQTWDQIFNVKHHYSSRSLTTPNCDTDVEFDVYHGDIYYPSLSAPYVLPSTTLIRRRCLDPDIRLIDEDPTCGDWDFFSRLSHRHSALYMDLQTTINRSHEDAVRLTRLPQHLQLSRRLDMIERVWKKDSAFYTEHRNEVDKIEHALLLKLATHQTLNADSRAARNSLRRRARLKIKDHNLKDTLLIIIINLPGSALLMNSAYFLKHTFAILRLR